MNVVFLMFIFPKSNKKKILKINIIYLFFGSAKINHYSYVSSFIMENQYHMVPYWKSIWKPIWKWFEFFGNDPNKDWPCFYISPIHNGESQIMLWKPIFFIFIDLIFNCENLFLYFYGLNFNYEKPFFHILVF